MNKNPIILACDYDGTYRRMDAVPEPCDIDAVSAFRKNGNLFGIVTERDVFEVMAIIGIFQNEYDFIVCSSGACAIVKTNDASAGVRLESVGVEGLLPTRLYCHGLSPYLVYEITDLLDRAGVSSVTVDSSGFKGGPGMAWDFKEEFEKKGGLGCRLHFWYGGQFFQDTVGRDALLHLFPVSRLTARFRNTLTADGAIGEIYRHYRGQVNIHRNGAAFDITVAEADKVYGIRRVLDFLRLPEENVRAFGDGFGDICMLREFDGIAVKDSAPEVIAAAKYTAGSVREAIEMIGG